MAVGDTAYVGTCTHVDESAEFDDAARGRLGFLSGVRERGARVKVAVADGEHAGFCHVLPVERCPWGPAGRDLAVIPCLFVETRFQGRGLGRALVAAGEAEARAQGRLGIAALAHFHDFWFMPASFFEHLGWSVADRDGAEAVLWLPLDDRARPPSLLRRRWRFSPVPGQVAVDLFWNAFCQTSAVEAARVREVAAEFGDAVVLREHRAEDGETLRRHGLPRGIFVDGREIGWGYEAPRDGVRKAIRAALAAREGDA
jgi:GNAT superfamily N-acetyltransferase